MCKCKDTNYYQVDGEVNSHCTSSEECKNVNYNDRKVNSDVKKYTDYVQNPEFCNGAFDVKPEYKSGKRQKPIHYIPKNTPNYEYKSKINNSLLGLGEDNSKKLEDLVEKYRQINKLNTSFLNIVKEENEFLKRKVAVLEKFYFQLEHIYNQDISKLNDNNLFEELSKLWPDKK